jgi:hypothetical protein
LVAVACFLHGRAKDLSAPTRTFVFCHMNTTTTHVSHMLLVSLLEVLNRHSAAVS